uniref:Uncharacterized protein n=1 Tax=Kalanchoe fedtschenkoi TaxID=63787 RepID=A0A7N1A7N5_KALFE
MQTSQQRHLSGNFHSLYQKAADPHHAPRFQILDSNMSSDIGSKGADLSFKTCDEQFFTLESFSPTDHLFVPYESPPQTVASILSNPSPYSSQGSQSYSSDPRYSPDNAYGTPVSVYSAANSSNELKYKLMEMENVLMAPDDTSEADSYYCNGSASSVPMWSQLKEIVPQLDINQLLLCCAQAVSDGDLSTAGALMDVLDQRVSISGDPVQRLGTYMLEGLRARLEMSGSAIYKSLKCTEPTSSEMMSYMHVLYQMCPYWKFAYVSANTAIWEAVENEGKIHIVDFQIAQGSQWVDLLKALAIRQGGPPSVRITGVDDAQSTLARGGGLHIVGEMLSKLAASCNIPFQFHEATMSDVKVLRENLVIVPGEALVFNFPYVLHHVPDESVSTENYRDELLRMVKSLAPKVLTLVEQESNTNTSAFVHRFKETLDYYTAMFESMDVARSRDDAQRLNAEMHCVAKDIISMIACEGAERVERHELLAKWRARFNLAGFTQCTLSPAVTFYVKDMLKDFHTNFRLEENKGALYLAWKNRAMVTCSAWR